MRLRSSIPDATSWDCHKMPNYIGVVDLQKGKKWGAKDSTPMECMGTNCSP